MLLYFMFILCSLNFVHSFNFTQNVSHPKSIEFSPDWKSLDMRPLPRWYDEAKIGIFLHWGIYSVPGFSSEWFWKDWEKGNKKIQKFMKQNYSPGFTYQDFAPLFKAEFVDPNKWTDLFLRAGARYVIITSKHHDGFALFPSKRSFSWNSYDVGPKQDLVGQLSVAIREKGLKFGLYHSLYEWFNPIYNEDKNNNFTTSYYVQTKLWPDLKQLIDNYKPSVLWSDGDWEAYDTYWKSTEFLAWLYNESPVKDEIVVNDRWGKGISCHHGDFYNCEDRYNPGKYQNHKWENAFTIDKKSWGFRHTMTLNDTLTINEILYQVASTVSCGGNVLINVGPTQHGTIVPIFQERLLDLGDWLKINGEAIYKSSPWDYQRDSINADVWYTCRISQDVPTPTANSVYAIFLTWPKDNRLSLKDVEFETYLMYEMTVLSINGRITPAHNYTVPCKACLALCCARHTVILDGGNRVVNTVISGNVVVPPTTKITGPCQLSQLIV